MVKVVLTTLGLPAAVDICAGLQEPATGPPPPVQPLQILDSGQLWPSFGRLGTEIAVPLVAFIEAKIEIMDYPDLAYQR